MKFPSKGMKAEEILNAMKEYEVEDVPFNRVWASTHRLQGAVHDASLQITEKNSMARHLSRELRIRLRDQELIRHLGKSFGCRTNRLGQKKHKPGTS